MPNCEIQQNKQFNFASSIFNSPRLSLNNNSNSLNKTSFQDNSNGDSHDVANHFQQKSPLLTNKFDLNLNKNVNINNQTSYSSLSSSSSNSSLSSTSNLDASYNQINSNTLEKNKIDLNEK